MKLFFTLEQGTTQHGKVQPLTDRGFRVFITAIDYSASNLLDGRITKLAAGVIAALSHAASIKPYARELVAAGLWDEHESGDGWVIHDYHEHQPTAEYMKMLSLRRSEAGKRGAAARWAGNSQSKPDGKSHGPSDANDHAISMAQELEPKSFSSKALQTTWQPGHAPRNPIASIRSQIERGILATRVDLEAELAAHPTLPQGERIALITLLEARAA